MRYLPIILLACLLLSCGDDEPTAPTIPDPEPQKVVKSFDAGAQLTCGTSAARATRSNADVFCIGIGYEGADKYESAPVCWRNGTEYGGPWLTRVWCYKYED